LYEFAEAEIMEEKLEFLVVYPILETRTLSRITSRDMKAYELKNNLLKLLC